MKSVRGALLSVFCKFQIDNTGSSNLPALLQGVRATSFWAPLVERFRKAGGHRAAASLFFLHPAGTAVKGRSLDGHSESFTE